MAITAILRTKIPLNGGAAFPTMKAVDAVEGAAVAFGEDDRKIVLLVKNAHATAAKTVTIKKGTGIQAVIDLTETVAAGEMRAFSLESGAFKQLTGVQKGNILVTGESADIQIGAILLP